MPFFFDRRRGVSTPESQTHKVPADEPTMSEQVIAPAASEPDTPTDTTLSATLAGDNTVWEAIRDLRHSGFPQSIGQPMKRIAGDLPVWQWSQPQRTAFVAHTRGILNGLNQGLAPDAVWDIVNQLTPRDHPWTDEDAEAFSRALSVIFRPEEVETDA